MTGPGERSVVLARDHATALALVMDWADRQVVPAHTTAELLELVGMVAATRADARNADVPGERVQVDMPVHVSAEIWRRDVGVREVARQRVRAAWARSLQEKGLQPLDWPPITVQYWRWGGEEVESAEFADLVTLTISGLAVPL